MRGPLVDYPRMNRAKFPKGRAIGLAFSGVLLALGAVQPAFAQSAEPVVSTPSDAGPPPAAPEIDRELARASGLFEQGLAALREKRERDAQMAFDAALDVFVVMRPALGSDPRFHPAYVDLVERIHTAEVGAGSTRRFLPSPPAAAPSALPSEASPLPMESTLADLGERIEGAHPTEEARQSNEAVLGAEFIDLPIELNDQVLGAIDLYSGKFKNWFSRALSRGMPHLPRIREILAEAGVPRDLAYVPIVESAFNPTALSRAKAKGLWQFIPSTGKQYGLKQDFFVDERSNMEKATVAAAQYLKRLYAMFGDWNLALAGYNAGEGRVQRAIKKARTNDFWALAKTRSFRSETKNYVPLIHAAIVISKSPSSYGIQLSPSEFTVAETIRVEASYPIATVARCGSVEADTIKQLNPDLRRGMTPASAFDLQVPYGYGGQISECLAGERALNYTRHTVRKRETLGQIARNFRVSASEIARVNGITVKTKLKPGFELVIPRMPQSAGKASAPARTASTSYRIRKGDTLSQVAARHSTTVEAIKALNGLNSNRLSIGQVLVVSTESSESSND